MSNNTTTNHGIFEAQKGQLDSKQVNLLRDLNSFYTPDIVDRVLVPIITQKDTLSLRVLDWLVTNYAKKNSVVYKHSNTKMKSEGPAYCLINVYSQYKSWLRNYRRRNFDPFRRRNRIYFTHKGERHETTVGQLNFIRWSHVYGVLEYTRQNLDVIEKDMNKCLNDVREQKSLDKQHNVRRKRKELSNYPIKKCFVYQVNKRVKVDE
jgi:hypothetical protein